MNSPDPRDEALRAIKVAYDAGERNEALSLIQQFMTAYPGTKKAEIADTLGISRQNYNVFTRGLPAIEPQPADAPTLIAAAQQAGDDELSDQLVAQALAGGWKAVALERQLGWTPGTARRANVRADKRNARQERIERESAFTRLRELKGPSENVRGGTPLDDPKREAAREFAEICAGLLDTEKFTVSELAEGIGMPYGTLRLRLIRHGVLEGAANPVAYRGILNRPTDTCRQGHPYTADNVNHIRGVRVCKACARIRTLRWLAGEQIEAAAATTDQATRDQHIIKALSQARGLENDIDLDNPLNRHFSPVYIDEALQLQPGTAARIYREANHD